MTKKKVKGSNTTAIIQNMKVFFAFVWLFFEYLNIKGDFKGGHKHGYGRFVDKGEENIYEGYYVDDQRNGVGRIFNKKKKKEEECFYIYG